jgi:hypothetical protein
MSKVSVKIGLTLKLFRESNYEYIRPEVAIEDIDPDGDVPKQIEDAVAALKLVWDASTEQMNSIIANEMPNVNAEMEVQIAKRLKNMEDAIRKMGDEVKKGRITAK